MGFPQKFINDQKGIKVGNTKVKGSIISMGGSNVDKVSYVIGNKTLALGYNFFSVSQFYQKTIEDSVSQFPAHFFDGLSGLADEGTYFRTRENSSQEAQTYRITNNEIISNRFGFGSKNQSRYIGLINNYPTDLSVLSWNFVEVEKANNGILAYKIAIGVEGHFTSGIQLLDRIHGIFAPMLECDDALKYVNPPPTSK